MSVMTSSASASASSLAAPAPTPSAMLPLPEDIRLRLSHYADEVKNQVSVLYDDQFKWLHDHLLSVQDTVAKIKNKKHATRSVMADIIKTPSRKRIRASKHNQIRPDLIRFHPSGLANQLAPPSSSKDIKQQTTANCINSLVPSKANYDLHSTVTNCGSGSTKPSSKASVLGQLPNGFHPATRENASKAPDRATSSPDENRPQPSHFETMSSAAVISKGLGLSSLTQVSHIHSQPHNVSFEDSQLSSFAQTPYSILTEEETAALSKSYQSPVKKPQPLTQKTSVQPASLSHPIAAPLFSGLASAKVTEPSATTVFVYQTAAPDWSAENELQTTDLAQEETEPEDGGEVAGHELSAIQEGEEEEDQAMAGPKSVCEPVTNSNQTKSSDSPNHPSGQSAFFSPVLANTMEPNPKSQDPTISFNPQQPSVETLSIEVLTEAERLHVSGHTPSAPSEEEVIHSSEKTTPPEDDEAACRPTSTGIILDSDVNPQPPTTDSIGDRIVTHVDPIQASQPTLQSLHVSNHREGVDTVLTAPLPAVPEESIIKSHLEPQEPILSDAANQDPTACILDPNVPIPNVQAIPSLESLNQSQATASLIPSKSRTPGEHGPTPEADEDPVVEPTDSRPQRLRSSSAQRDTTIEVPLNDKPSHLRNTRPLQSQTSDLNSRTPAASTHNLFTPGNGRAALIHSPQSQWSSKPIATAWKPNKTPAVAYGAGLGIGTAKSDLWKLPGMGGSPVAPLGSKFTRVSSTIQSHASDHVKSQDGSWNRISLLSDALLSDAQAYTKDPRRTSKRTSTDAGLPYTSEAQESRVSRPYAPAPLPFGNSGTDKGKKVVDDLKNRLSKIQRESAMPERTQHTNVVADLFHPIQRNSLTTSGSSILTMPLNKASSQTSISAPTKASWGASQPWTSAEASSMAKSQASRPVVLGPLSQQHPRSPPPVASFKTYAGVPLVDRIPSAELVPALQVGDPEIPSMKNVDSVNPQAPVIVKRGSVGDLVAAFEAKKPSAEPSAGPATTSPARSVTLTHEAKSKSPVDVAMGASASQMQSAAHPRSTTPDCTPPLQRFDRKVSTSVTQEEIIEGPGFHDDMVLRDEDEESNVNEHDLQDGDVGGQNSRVVVGQSEEDLIDLSGEKIEVSSSKGGFHDVEGGVSSDYDNENESGGIDEDEDAGQSLRLGTHEGHHNDQDEEEQSQHSAQLSPSGSHSQDANSQTSRPTSNLGRITPPPGQTAAVKTPPTGGIMGVFKAGAALATSWTSSKNKPELKSLQLAAAAAKKEQEEKERKAAVKEEREQRRIAAVERKQAEERERTEADRKARAAEVDRKKKEREESSRTRAATAKAKLAPILTPGHHRDESIAGGDIAKKRKAAEAEANRTLEQPKKVKAQKLEPGSVARVTPGSALKTGSNSTFQPSRIAPAAPSASAKSLSKQHAAAAASTVGVKSMAEINRIGQTSKTMTVQQSSKLPKPSVTGSTKQKLSTATTAPLTAASAAAKTPVASTSSKKGKHKPSEEYVELPEIDSEYSDDDEEEHQRKEAALPDWAQSVVMREALVNQRKLNPNDIFGATIPAPAMDEIFRGRSSRFRHRTSSANWTGTDQLTAMEEAEYAKRMGYHNKRR